jgi:hypothetical protein
VKRGKRIRGIEGKKEEEKRCVDKNGRNEKITG